MLQHSQQAAGGATTVSLFFTFDSRRGRTLEGAALFFLPLVFLLLKLYASDVSGVKGSTLMIALLKTERQSLWENKKFICEQVVFVVHWGRSVV